MPSPFWRQLHAIEEAYEFKVREIEHARNTLENEHMEWLALDRREKLLRLNAVAILKNAGREETVYSPLVKTLAKQIQEEEHSNPGSAAEYLAKNGVG